MRSKLRSYCIYLITKSDTRHYNFGKQYLGGFSVPNINRNQQTDRCWTYNQVIYIRCIWRSTYFPNCHNTWIYKFRTQPAYLSAPVNSKLRRYIVSLCIRTIQPGRTAMSKRGTVTSLDVGLNGAKYRVSPAYVKMQFTVW